MIINDVYLFFVCIKYTYIHIYIYLIMNEYKCISVRSCYNICICKKNNNKFYISKNIFLKIFKNFQNTELFKSGNIYIRLYMYILICLNYPRLSYLCFSDFIRFEIVANLHSILYLLCMTKRSHIFIRLKQILNDFMINQKQCVPLIFQNIYKKK
ncbi:hypothetical protein KUTeg_015797 [Tegillarca granosa]|uniref:Uncharacterized protein n=1 Tax=Tegillarca granosa TaxID=220873 RepID=A0ABQ9EMT7_TEGGR|nr:hypothetical protein KUTeg_015797 [Tegillarca granosa]